MSTLNQEEEKKKKKLAISYNLSNKKEVRPDALKVTSPDTSVLEIKALLALATQARENKDFDKAYEIEDQFKAQTGKDIHEYEYLNNTAYKARIDQQIKMHKGPVIDYPSTDSRSRNYQGTPNEQFMYPNLSGKQKGEQISFTNEAISMALPIPGLEKMGKIPRITNKLGNKADDISKGFQSEIDWAKWNKEIPNNTTLLKEYNAIEQQSKAGGTWMKNPDGSAFKGTPEQFVQQNSENFKKSFPNIIKDTEGNIQTNYHGTPNIFNYFKDLTNRKGIVTQGNRYGDGIYTSTSKKEAQAYQKNGELHELYINSNNPQSFEFSHILNDFSATPEYKKQYDLLLKNHKNAYDKKYKDFKSNILSELELEKEYKLLDNDFFNKREKLDIEFSSKQVTTYDYLKPKNETQQVIPFSNYPKSMKYNNGMFDMTNPNIYKSLLPLTGYGLHKQQKKTSKKN